MGDEVRIDTRRKAIGIKQAVYMYLCVRILYFLLVVQILIKRDLCFDCVDS